MKNENTNENILTILSTSKKKVFKYMLKQERAHTPSLEWSTDVGCRSNKGTATVVIFLTAEKEYRLVSRIPEGFDESTRDGLYSYVIDKFNAELETAQRWAGAAA